MAERLRRETRNLMGQPAQVQVLLMSQFFNFCLEPFNFIVIKSYKVINMKIWYLKLYISNKNSINLIFTY